MRQVYLPEIHDTGPPTEDGAYLLGRLLHRFRNSLTSVRGYAELLTAADVPAERRRQWAGNIVTQLDRIEALQDRLHASARGERPVGEHSLGMILRAAIRRSRERASDEGAAIDVRLLIHDVLIDGDGEALTEAFAAAIDNAIEASVAAGSGHVDIGVGRDGEDWVLRIVDHGDGLDPEAGEHAGTAFFSQKSGHLGLGVYLCRSILQRHGLDLELANASAGGAMVTIRGRRVPSYL